MEVTNDNNTNYTETDRQTDRQTGRQAGRQADRQTDRQTDSKLTKFPRQTCWQKGQNQSPLGTVSRGGRRQAVW